MWINVYRESAFSYSDYNFPTVEAAEEYLAHEKCIDRKVHFVESPKDGLSKSYHTNIWRESIVLTAYEGTMPDNGAGFHRKRPHVTSML